MIRIKPEPEYQVQCPKCYRKTVVKETTIHSAFTLADCYCDSCNFEFYQTLPVSHTVINTLTIDKVDKKRYPADPEETWLTKAVLKTVQCVKEGDVSIKKHIYKTCDRVVILNTLDYLYGHVLLKLYNSVYHLDHDKNLGLIIIVPKLFEWLVPEGCAEAWTVDLPLSEFVFNHVAVQKFISREFERFDTIYLSKAYSHPDFTPIDISRLSGITPFDLASFRHTPFTITFVLREDRWWWNHIADYWYYRLCRKLGILKTGNTLLSLRQNHLVKKTIELISRQIPGANFYIVGLGTVGKFKGYAVDERRNIIDSTIEKDWCKIYAQSHVVVGVHGSNMLLPTAHAAGCVEILPEDRFGNIAQDISVRYRDRKQLFFYRFADQYARPKAIAAKVISITKHFDVFEKNMCQNVNSEPQNLHPTTTNTSDDIYAIER